VSLAIKYESVEDARMRLRNTVVLYRGEPVLIKEVTKGEGKDDIIRVLFNEIPAKPVEKRRGDGPFVKEDGDQKKYISSKHFDIAPFRMGYVNNIKGNGAFYCSRLPNRVQKQGLCLENFKASDNFGCRIPFDSFLLCKEVSAMVAGRYPSIERAMELLDKVKSVAFHRDFALVKDEVIPQLVYIFHKGAKAGMFMKGEIMLGEKFTCLKESLDEMQLKTGRL
jgi:hypothetical protein